MMIFLRMLARPAARRRPAARPALEVLEARALPAVLYPLSITLRRLDGPGNVPGYTPAQIRTAYGLDGVSFGDVVGDGSGQTIAIVTAHDNPNLADDLAAFDAYFHLPAPPSLTRVGQDGSPNLPAADAAWAQETSLDVQWAHVVAPGASILVVEANSADQADLYAAVDTASASPNVSVVSMSFGGAEDPSELQADSHFKPSADHPGVTFVAAAGDSGTVTYPAASPYVVGVGGTTLTLDPQGNRQGETAWAHGGGGLSQYEATPAYQQNVPPARLSNRGTPDVAYDADPNTGFAVYDSYGSPDNPWVSVGGTSAGAPQWAALLAVANQGRGLGGGAPIGGAGEALPLLYAEQGTPAFFDVTAGGNGHYQAGPGYDLVTGLGSPKGAAVITGLLEGIAPPTPTTNLHPPGTGNGLNAVNDGPPADPPPLDPPASPAPGPTAPLTVQGVTVSAVAGHPTPTLLATVTDNSGSLTAAALAATIDWGDGRSSAGSVVVLGPGHFAVTGVLDYAHAGIYPITITVTAHTDAGDVTAGDQALATIVPAPRPQPPEPLAPQLVAADPLPQPVLSPPLPARRQARHATHAPHGHHRPHRPSGALAGHYVPARRR